MAEIKNQIETQIRDCQVQGIRISWTEAKRVQIGWDVWYRVKGFKIQAVVKNVSAGLTGLEIAYIIFAVAFLAAVVAIIVMTAWLVFKTVGAAEQVAGPLGVVGIGLILFIILIGALLLLFGVRFERGKFKVGR